VISSRQNPLVKLLNSLHSRHGRQKSGLFLLEGIRLVEEALAAGLTIRHAVYSPRLQNNRRAAACLQQLEATSSCRPQLISEALLRWLADTEQPQGLLVAAEQPQPQELDLCGVTGLLLVDGVQDPGNLGTIIRTADALGTQMVLLLIGTVDAYNEKVVRAAMGSLFHVRLQQSLDADAVLPLIKNAGFQLVVSALEQAVPYDQADYGERVALVVGNEGAGVSRELLHAADLRVIIPILGQAESLNVAVATGIILARLAQR
jgi:TrmH family RNA methyltransferase